MAEIKFGDNDHLAAMVTNLLQAPLLILLTVVDGLYATDPDTDPAATLVPDRAAHRQFHHGPGRAGPQRAGHRRHAEQAAGRPPGDRGRRIGHHGQRRQTRHARRHLRRRAGRHAVPAARRHRARLEALARLHGPAQGTLLVDAGAQKAVQHQGRSLLPIGVVEVAGSFGKGDVVALCDADGTEFARGLTNYSSTDAGRIRGLRTEQIGEVLGGVPYEEMVHRDNLVVTV